MNPNKPIALGIAIGRAKGPAGWEYSVMIGEEAYGFAHDELIPLGWVVDQAVHHGADDDLDAVPMDRRVVRWPEGRDAMSGPYHGAHTSIADELIEFTLTREHALVLFSWLSRTSDAGGPADFEDQAEQRVLWDLEDTLKSVFTEPFPVSYQVLLEAARMKIRDR